MLFCDYVVKWKSKARLNVSDGWKLGQDQVIRDHIGPHLDNLQISKITSEDISDILSISKNKGHSENQQRKIYNVLSKLFGDAIHFFELITRNPVRKRFHRPVVHEVERSSLTPEQSFIVLEYTMHHPLFGAAVWIQLLAGIRVSEIQGLQWKDIDFEENTIHIRRAYKRHAKKMEDYPKGKKQYRVPIAPKLKNYLMAHKNDSSFVCPNTVGKMLCAKYYDEYLKTVQVALKLPIGSSHGLRHSCARLYASLGASDEDLQKLLGHKNLVSIKTYIHRTDENLFSISKKIA